MTKYRLLFGAPYCSISFIVILILILLTARVAVCQTGASRQSKRKHPPANCPTSSSHHHHHRIIAIVIIIILIISSSLLFDNCGYCQSLTMLSQQLLLDHHNDDRWEHHVDHQVNIALCHQANHHGGGRRRRRRACRKANIAQIVQT